MNMYLKICTQALCALLLVGCAKTIDVEKRWIPETDKGLSPEAPIVLVEEYTGQECINCPQAAKLLSELSSKYAGHLITVAMHTQWTGQTKEALRSEAAETYATRYNIPRIIPGIMVNRKTISETKTLYSHERSSWAEAIRRSVEVPASHRLTIEADKASGRKVSVGVKAVALNTEKRDLDLTVWVVEDTYGEQKVGDEVEARFFHHNVLRQIIVDKASYDLGSEYKTTVSLIDRVSVPDNAKIVAFVSDRKSGEIYEAAIRPLGKGIEKTPNNVDTPDTPKYSNGKVSFIVGDKVLKSGDEVMSVKNEKDNKGIIVFESPIVKVKLPEGMDTTSPFDLKFEKLDHTSDSECGISSICANVCMQMEKLSESYIHSNYKYSEGDSYSIHYGVHSDSHNLSDTYRVRLSMLRDGQEVAHLIFAFKHNEDANVSPIVPPANPPAPINPSEPIDTKGESGVILMDFTGQRCPACGYKVEELALFQKWLGPQLILVAFHQQWLNINSEFCAEETRAYDKHIVVPYFPTLVVNNDASLKNPSLPYPAIESAIAKKAPLKSEFSAKLIGDNNVELSFRSVAVTGESQLSNHPKVNVLFWVTQNNMRGYQSGLNKEILHQHIFRGSMNGIWGESYTLGDNYTRRLALPRVSKLVPKDCEVIAIILDAQTRVFIDAMKVKLN